MTASTTHLDFKYHHAGISVPDLEASITWYRDMLGFEVEARNRLLPVPANVAFLRRGDMRIELFQPDQGSLLPDDRRYPDTDIRTHGNKHVAFAVRDINEAAEYLKARKADIVFVKQSERASVLFLRDNSGNLLEFFQQPDLW